MRPSLRTPSLGSSCGWLAAAPPRAASGHGEVSPRPVLGPKSGRCGLCCRVSHILNMAREIDNFYPERFTYHNVRLWDEESEQLLPHWKETHRFVEAARWGPAPAPCLLHSPAPAAHLTLCPSAPCPVHRAQGTRVLVHCKMGVSRSAATVMAYAMKQYGWGLEQALRHVQELRPAARPNPGFLRQLHTYQGILTARHGAGCGHSGGARQHNLPRSPGLPLCSRQSHVWEQKAGGASPEQPPAPEIPTPSPPLLPEAGNSEADATGPQESQAAPSEEPGPRPRINLRGVMRSISLLEPPLELESTPMAEGLPEVGRGPQVTTGQARVHCPRLLGAQGQSGDPVSWLLTWSEALSPERAHPAPQNQIDF